MRVLGTFVGALVMVGCAQDLGRSGDELGPGGGGKADELDSDTAEPADADACTLELFQQVEAEGPAAGESWEDVECGPYTVTFIDAHDSVAGYDTWVVSADLGSVEVVVSEPEGPAVPNGSWADGVEGLFASINGNMFGCYARDGYYVEASTNPEHDDRCPGFARGAFGDEGPLAHRQFPIGLHCNAGTCTHHQPASAPRSTHMLIGEEGMESWPPSGTEPLLGCTLDEWSLGRGCSQHHAVSGMLRLVAEGQVPDADVDGANTHLYGQLLGWIPLLGTSEDGRRVYLGMSRIGAQATARTLVEHLGPGSGRVDPLWEAVGFDSGGSPSLWLGSGMFQSMSTAADLAVPVRIGLRVPPD